MNGVIKVVKSERLEFTVLEALRNQKDDLLSKRCFIIKRLVFER